MIHDQRVQGKCGGRICRGKWKCPSPGKVEMSSFARASEECELCSGCRSFRALVSDKPNTQTEVSNFRQRGWRTTAGAAVDQRRPPSPLILFRSFEQSW